MSFGKPTKDAFDRFLDRMPPQVEETFTPKQLEAMRKAIESQAWSLHPVDARLSLPWISHSFYLVILVGAERRHRRRRTGERKNSCLQIRNSFIAITAVTIAGIATLLLLVFLSQLKWPTFQEMSHPAKVPFKPDQASCESSGRVWLEDKCIDHDHDPTF